MNLHSLLNHHQPPSLRGAKRRGNPGNRANNSGLLRFARNDGASVTHV